MNAPNPNYLFAKGNHTAMFTKTRTTLSTKTLINSSTIVCLLAGAVWSSGALANSPERTALCSKAVSAASTYIDAMKKIAVERKANGELNSAEFDSREQQLNAQLALFSMDQCLSNDQQQAFYQCLAERFGRVPACAGL